MMTEANNSSVAHSFALKERMIQLRQEALIMEPSDPARAQIIVELSQLYADSLLYPADPALYEWEVSKVDTTAAASGGFGDCWKGLFLGQHQIAMKCSRSHIAPEIAMRRAEREMKVWKSLQHPNILPFIGPVILETPVKALYMVSPWMENSDLGKYINANPNADCLRLLTQIATGLEYLHTSGVIHGDLKAANILISGTGDARIADFGLSEMTTEVDENTQGCSSAWKHGGNPRWQAPELFENYKRTKASDIFAFGRVIYEAYTRDVPFAGFPRLRIYAIVDRGELPPRPSGKSSEPGGFNDDMWQFMARCCETKPQQRPDAHEVVAYLLSISKTPDRACSPQPLPHAHNPTLERCQNSPSALPRTPEAQHRTPTFVTQNGMEEAIELRSKYQHFRVLIMGRANAGKTTILKAICRSREAPQVYNQRGRKVTAKDSILSPTSLRGVHNIEYELRFRSAPGFVFHDSCGFEAGSVEELEKVREFINNRAAERSVDKQLHAIWFCIPTDHDARMITAAELDFFQRCDIGKVPVIAIFTKFDSLDNVAYQELRREGFEHSEAQYRAPRRAEEYFERVHLNRILEQRYPPKRYLCVRNMHEVDGHVIKRTVTELLEKTSDALDTDALKLLLATVQNNNTALCIANFINSGFITATAQEAFKSGDFLSEKQLGHFVWAVGTSFPYLWYQQKEILDGQLSLLRKLGIKFFNMFDGSLAQLRDGVVAVLVAVLPTLNGDLPLPLQVLHLGASAAICCGILCQEKIRTVAADDFQKIFEYYEDSGAGHHVRAAIREAFDDVGPYDTMEQNAKLLQIIFDHKDIGPLPE